MLQAFRIARWPRLILYAAALIAIAGSFGLHPEPNDAPAAFPIAGDAPVWTADASDSSAPHGCFACLTHRTVSLSGLPVFTPSAAPAVGPVLFVPTRALRLFEPRLDDGRAPPSLL